MSIIGSAQEQPGRSYDSKDDGVETRVRMWHVRSDDPQESENAVLAASGIPAKFDPHPNNSLARCRHLQAKQGDIQDRLRWTVTATYSTKYADPDQENPNPLERPLRVDPISVEFDVPQARDQNGKLYANSAGARFDPPYVQTVAIPGLVFRRNVPTFNMSLSVQYKHAISTDDFYLQPAGHALCKYITWSDLQFENDISYREERIEVWFNDIPWNPVELLDAGLTEFFAPLTKPRVILDENGAPVNSPARLDGTGHVLEDPEADDVFLQFKGFKELPFSTLNLE